jgi:ABC-type sulfate transport system permease subunit
LALTLAALAVVTLFLIVPAVFVFAQAFAKGIHVFADALTQADTLAAIRLTLVAATIRSAPTPFSASPPRGASPNSIFPARARW